MAVPPTLLCPTAVSRPYSEIRSQPVRVASLRRTNSAVAWIGFRNYTLTLMPFNFIISDTNDFPTISFEPSNPAWDNHYEAFLVPFTRTHLLSFARRERGRKRSVFSFREKGIPGKHLGRTENQSAAIRNQFTHCIQ